MARIQLSPEGLIQRVTGLSTIPSKWFLKARWDGYRTRIMAAHIPVYTDMVLSPRSGSALMLNFGLDLGLVHCGSGLDQGLELNHGIPNWEKPHSLICVKKPLIHMKNPLTQLARR